MHFLYCLDKVNSTIIIIILLFVNLNEPQEHEFKLTIHMYTCTCIVGQSIVDFDNNYEYTHVQ